MNNSNFGFPRGPSHGSSFSQPFSSTPSENRMQRPRFGYTGPPSYPRPRSSATKPNPGGTEHGSYLESSSMNNNYGDSTVDTTSTSLVGFVDSFASNGSNVSDYSYNDSYNNSAAYYTADNSFSSPSKQSSFGQSQGTPPFAQSRGQSTVGQSRGQSTFGQSRGQSTFGQSRGQSNYGQSPGQSNYGQSQEQSNYGQSQEQSYDQSQGQSNFSQSRGQSNYGQSRGQSTFGQSRGQSTFDQSRGQSTFGQARGQSAFGQSQGRSSFGQSPGQSSFGRSPGQSSFDHSQGQSNYGQSRGQSNYGQSRGQSTFGQGRGQSRGRSSFGQSPGQYSFGYSQGQQGDGERNFQRGRARGRGNFRGRFQKNTNPNQTPYWKKSMEPGSMLPEGAVAGRVSFTRWRCDLCNLPMTSQVNLDMHLNGAKHKKKALMQQAAEGVLQDSNVKTVDAEGKTFKCDVCGIVTNSTLQLQMHLDGIKHKAKLALKEKKDQMDECGPEKEEAGEKVKDESGAKSNGGTVRPLPEDFDSPQPAKMAKFSCSTCNVIVNSSTQLQQHMESKKHQAVVEGKPIFKPRKFKQKPNSEKEADAAEDPSQVVLGVKSLETSFVAGEDL